MNIIVNGTPLLAPLTGIGQYVRHLFTAMENLPDTDIHMYYGTRFERGVKVPSPGTAKAVQQTYGMLRRLIPKPRTLRRFVEKRLFSRLARPLGDNCLYHEPNFVALPYDGPLVLTVCDLSCFDHPEMHPAERVALMQRDMPASIERADQIVVISEATGQSLQQWFRVAPDRISVTHLAADPRFHPRESEILQQDLVPLGLIPGGYLLSVGTLEPRKNLTTLFAAYASLPDALRQRFPLVVAGMSGWHQENMLQAAERLIQRGELRLLGYVPDGLIPSLYAGAAAFSYPSRYEGFGLPPLEAMASGVPVVTSNQTSLPEVVGDAGLMVAPDDVDGLRLSLLQLLDDRAFADDLARRGLERASSFSWERCAQETRSIYTKVMDRRGIKSGC